MNIHELLFTYYSCCASAPLIFMYMNAAFRVKIAWLQENDIMLPLAKNIQGGPKKLSYRTLSVSSLNIDQFSQFFHQ